MALFMTVIMTGCITLLQFGLSAEFPVQWATTFITAWPVAWLAALVGAPAANRLSARICKALAKY